MAADVFVFVLYFHSDRSIGSFYCNSLYLFSFFLLFLFFCCFFLLFFPPFLLFSLCQFQHSFLAYSALFWLYQLFLFGYISSFLAISALFWLFSSFLAITALF